MPDPIGPSLQVLKKVKLNPRKFSDEEQELRDLWNSQLADKPVDTDYGTTFPPKDPPIFQSDSPIVGSGLAKMAEKFFKIAPNLRNKASRIQYGPGRPAINSLQEQDISPYNFDLMNLLGVTGLNNREINLNPGLNKWDRYSEYPPDEVLGHELTHVSGYRNEVKPNIAEELIKAIKKKQLIGPSEK